jgi:hypothetical protein
LLRGFLEVYQKSAGEAESEENEDLSQEEDK